MFAGPLYPCGMLLLRQKGPTLCTMDGLLRLQLAVWVIGPGALRGVHGTQHVCAFCQGRTQAEGKRTPIFVRLSCTKRHMLVWDALQPSRPRIINVIAPRKDMSML